MSRQSAEGGRSAHLEEIGHGTPGPPPRGEGRAVQDAVPDDGVQVAGQPEQGGPKGTPRDPLIPVVGQPAQPQPEPRAADEVADGDHGYGDEREADQLVGPEHRVQHDQGVIKRQLAAVGNDKRPDHGLHFGGDVHEPERHRQAKEACRCDGRARETGKPCDQRRVPAGALFEPGSEGLADGRQAAASGKGSDQHEEGEDLRNDAERCLNGGIQPSCHPQIRHGNGKMAQHHAELRHGEGNEFPGGRQGAVRRGVCEHGFPLEPGSRSKVSICQIKFDESIFELFFPRTAHAVLFRLGK